ncbi:MAG: hypothetical protein JO061_06775 [Acidobacteriaceae bacterium]|nr:hypothetical protein [Acidobacteriaceae bacterium]
MRHDLQAVTNNTFEALGARRVFSRITSHLFVLALMLDIAAAARAATLRPDTVTAWNQYLQTANANLENRMRSGSSFLWSLQTAERASRLRSGEIIVQPVSAQNPRRVPGGLIHDWIGAMFLPDTTVDDVLSISRNYDHYRDFYRPSVTDSKVIARNGSEDKFSMVLINRDFFLKTALKLEYQATNVTLDGCRFYSVSRTTRVQEIKDYGSADEQALAEGEGGGYVWKLFSVIRFEERDGGVYVEIEAIGLSRDIPVAIRPIAEPIVRRVSRRALALSLQQTKDAVASLIAEREPSRLAPIALNTLAGSACSGR